MARVTASGRIASTRTNSIVQPHNGYFEVAPSFVAATATNARWIDGTSAGSNAARSAYMWAIQTLTGAAVAQFDSATFHSGSNSLKLSTTGTGQRVDARLIKSGSGAAAAPFYIKARPSTAYRYSIWIKTNVTSGSSTGAGLLLAELASDASTNPATPVSVATAVTQDWTQYTGTFTTSATTAFFTPRLSVIGNGGAGTLIMDAWFDDFEIIPLVSDRVAVSGRVAP